MSDAADELFKEFQTWLSPCAPHANAEQRWLLECAWFGGVSSAMQRRSSLSAIAVVRHMDRLRARRQASPL